MPRPVKPPAYCIVCRVPLPKKKPIQCAACRLTIRQIHDAHHWHKGRTTPLSDIDERVQRLAERAAAGKPLFGEKSESQPR